MNNKYFIIKSHTHLGKNVIKYINWKYSGNRSLCTILFCNASQAIRVVTRCHKKDHYPHKLRKMYRTKTVLTEFINIRTMLLEIKQNRL